MTEKELILKLHDIGAIKFGEFTLKSGIISPYYVDLRPIISYPKLLRDLSELMWQKVVHVRADCVCGVPYTALPLACGISLRYNVPMIMRRKEAKDYGTKRIIEGEYKPGQTCIIVEDLFTTGGSAIETIILLEERDLIVKDVVIILDREQGGVQRVEQKGYNVYVVWKLSDIIQVLSDNQRIDREQLHAITQFTRENQCTM